MILTFHTPKGVVEVDTRSVTDAELAELRITRQKLQEIDVVGRYQDAATIADKLEIIATILGLTEG